MSIFVVAVGAVCCAIAGYNSPWAVLGCVGTSLFTIGYVLYKEYNL